MFDPTALLTPAALQQGLEERPEETSAETRAAVVKRVVAMFQAAKQAQESVSDPYLPGGEWANYLAERAEFYTALREGQIDVAGAWLERFWRNSLGAIVKEYAKYEQLTGGEEERVQRFQHNVTRNLLIWKDIFRQPMESLRIPSVGNPWGLFLEGELVCPKATRFHAHASQIAQLLCDVPEPVVLDIGAGYGGMSYYLLRDHERFSVIDVDLPETLAIAAYYLLSALPDGKFFLYGEGDLPSAEQMSSYTAVFLPNFCLPQLDDRAADLCLNSFSLSEMPPATNREYIQQVQRLVRRYFLHNNMDRSGVVNRGFERIPASSYPIDSKALGLVYKTFDLFHGHDGDYREFLYRRL